MNEQELFPISPAPRMREGLFKADVGNISVAVVSSTITFRELSWCNSRRGVEARMDT